MDWRRRAICCAGMVLGLAWAATGSRAWADQNYSQQVFFENSLSPKSYYYSAAGVSAPSTLRLVDGKLPVETSSFISAPNALRLEWRSAPQGGWAAEIRLYGWRNRMLGFPGAYLWIWVCAPQGLKAADLPRMALRAPGQPRVALWDVGQTFSAPLKLGAYAHDLAPGKWIRLRIPLADLRTASVDPFDPHRVNTIVWLQGSADNQPHTLLVDDIRIEDDPGTVAVPAAPNGVQVKGYERHFDVTWEPVNDAHVAQYVIYRSVGARPFQPVGVQRPGVNRYCDYAGDTHMTATYHVTARTPTLVESPPSEEATATTHPMTDDELLTMVEEASLRYYWEAAEPHSGMARENQPGDDDLVALGASGFGVMAIVAGTERGLISRAQAVDRLLRISGFLERADRYHGAWPHFLSGATGRRMPVFGQYENGADLVETSFMMQGLLAARQYFKNDGTAGRELYDRITKLWEGVEWSWFSPASANGTLYWHWSPEYSFFIAHRLTGWNEVMITYLLAIASPTHPIPASAYYEGWASQAKTAQEYREGWGNTKDGNLYANGNTYEGIHLDVGVGNGGPLFFTHYSFMGLDPNSFTDRYTNYFANNRAISLINHAYCVRNPRHWEGYGTGTWGISAVDGPEGYEAYEPKPQMDDGTIAPTGAISAMAYTPEESMAALKHYYRDLGAEVWSIYGFRDSFNLQQNWFSGIAMGLNQAPMTVMIENHRSGAVWKSFMTNPEIQTMVKHIAAENGGK
jgi:hypothetical protein